MTDSEQQLPFRVQHIPDITGELIDVLREIAELILPVLRDPVIEISLTDSFAPLPNFVDRSKQPADAEVSDKKPDKADRKNNRQEVRTLGAVSESSATRQ